MLFKKKSAKGRKNMTGKPKRLVCDEDGALESEDKKTISLISIQIHFVSSGSFTTSEQFPREPFMNVVKN
jgi:hypothetical protein